MKLKNCWRNSASTLDIAYCTRSMSLMIVDISVPVACFLEKKRKSAEAPNCRDHFRRLVDHAETGVVHQIGAGIIEDSLQHG